jgi:hypothetical protein
MLWALLTCPWLLQCTSEEGRVADRGSPSGATGGAAEAGGSSSGGTVNAGGSGDTSSGGTAGETGLGDPNRTELLRAHFQEASLGVYAAANVQADFGAAPTWNDGLGQGRATIVEEGTQRFLRVTYPAGQYGPSNGGVQFPVALGGPHEELFFSYRVRFAAGFDFVKGGKLPGLVGGSSPTGCAPKTDGFSARNMWRPGGAAVQYVYYPSQPNNCGDDIDYETGGAPVLFAPGTWHTVEHHLVMNTLGESDGVLEAWVDGTLVVQRLDMVWRGPGATYAIDALYFSTFFGGGDSSWAPATAQVIDFDDLVVADGAISHQP